MLGQRPNRHVSLLLLVVALAASLTGCGVDSWKPRSVTASQSLHVSGRLLAGVSTAGRPHVETTGLGWERAAMDGGLESDEPTEAQGGWLGLVLVAFLGGAMVVFVVGLVSAITGHLAALLQWNTKPLMGDPRVFRVSDHYSSIVEYAGVGARLERFEAKFVKSDGSMDLLASYEPEAVFVFTTGEAVANAPAGVPRDLSKMRRVTVAVERPWRLHWHISTSGKYGTVNRGLQRTREASGSEPRFPTPPQCTLSQLWQTAIDLGAPRDAVATIQYDKAGYHFTIEDEAYIDFDPSGSVIEQSGRALTR